MKVALAHPVRRRAPFIEGLDRAEHSRSVCLGATPAELGQPVLGRQFVIVDKDKEIVATRFGQRAVAHMGHARRGLVNIADGIHHIFASPGIDHFERPAIGIVVDHEDAHTDAMGRQSLTLQRIKQLSQLLVALVGRDTNRQETHAKRLPKLELGRVWRRFVSKCKKPAMRDMPYCVLPCRNPSAKRGGNENRPLSTPGHGAYARCQPILPRSPT